MLGCEKAQTAAMLKLPSSTVQDCTCETPHLKTRKKNEWCNAERGSEVAEHRPCVTGDFLKSWRREKDPEALPAGERSFAFGPEEEAYWELFDSYDWF
ncbi:Retrovirus-related Pol polyprotein from transposon TNT 1-94 [Fusarium oxysporum f. sp. albedinis]|nr:Retrovirus-related Pol polyprotein from transposon TNT 1-94 [Fusarium oxysporum f. sp. albedinis]